MAEDRAASVFFEIHTDLPREGPGDSESTRRAFRMLKGLPKEPAILDVGCGPGAQTVDLLGLTAGHVTAVDNHQPFLNSLTATLERKGLSGRADVVNADMRALDFDAGTFDLIWAEGSIYIMGFENALRQWKPLLRGTGFLVATEATWLRASPPEELRSFWTRAYPAMLDVDGNLAVIRRSGYEAIGHFTLPETAWWNPYYTSVEQKLRALKDKYGNDPDALRVLETEEDEIDLYRRFSEYYGYVFYVMQVRDGKLPAG